MMKRAVAAGLIIIAAALALASCAVNSGDKPIDMDNIKVRAISELNLDGETDDHAGESTKNVSVELNYREFTTLRYADTGAKNPHYPRIKRAADGTYILLYMDHQYGSHIDYVTSSDALNWSAPQKLFAAVQIKDGADLRKYMNGDAVVLQNGDILAFSSFRADKGYKTELDENGLAMRRSTDNGRTWSEETVVYVGTNWECCPIQLASGEIQVYFTQTAPMIYKYGFNDTRRSSGVGLIRSLDNGETWTPEVTGAPYQAQQVMQQFVGVFDGVRHYTDQMPVAVELHNGKIALVAESMLAGGNYKISAAYSDDNWSQWLGEDEPGPATRTSNMFTGVGPYIAQFKSGETVLSYRESTYCQLRIGDENGENFASQHAVFEKAGIWGSMLVDGTHGVVVAFPNVKLVSETTEAFDETILVGRAYLNHTLFAKKLTPKIDGDNSDWKENTDALFVGSESQAQASVSVAYDNDNVYFLVERLDRYLEDGDRVTLYIDAKGSDEYYTLALAGEGIESFKSVKSFDTTDAEPEGIKCKSCVVGNINSSEGGHDEGIIYEVSVPRSYFGIEEDAFSFIFTLDNSDKGIKSKTDILSQAVDTAKATWQTVRLK